MKKWGSLMNGALKPWWVYGYDGRNSQKVGQMLDSKTTSSVFILDMLYEMSTE